MRTSNVISFPVGTSDGDKKTKKKLRSSVSYDDQSGAPKEDKSVRKRLGRKAKTGRRYERSNFKAEYRSWDNMKQRCRRNGYVLDPRFERFEDFMSHVGPMPGKGYTLDRIDPNNPEYSPDNCRWASKKLQTSNRRNTVFAVDAKGQQLTVAEISRRTGIPSGTIRSRVARQATRSTVSTMANSLASDRCIEIWSRAMAAVHKQGAQLCTKKERKMLTESVRQICDNTYSSPADLIDTVVQHWPEVTEFCEDCYGAYKSPSVPTALYLAQYATGVANWYFLALRTRKKEWTRDLMDWEINLLMDYPKILSRLYRRDGELREMKKRLRQLEDGVSDPKRVVTESMREAVARENWLRDPAEWTPYDTGRVPDTDALRAEIKRCKGELKDRERQLDLEAVGRVLARKRRKRGRK